MNQQQKVLIVDDSKTINYSISTILSENGFITYSAYSAEEAFNIIESDTFDLIILDIVLPEKNGFHFCNSIKQRNKYKNIPVIFITGVSDKDNILHAFELGAVDFIIKPFDSRELLARVKTHIELKITKERLEKEIVINKQKAESLAESERSYRLLFENMSDGFIVNKVFFNKDKDLYDFKIIAANNAFSQIVDRDIDEIIGINFKDILPNISEHCDDLLNISLNGGSKKLHYFYEKCSKYLNITVFYSKYGQFAAVIEDISMQKNAEIELQKSEQQLKELNATKDKFFSIIAHDLRSPFTSIIGLSEILANDSEIELEQCKEFSTLIYQSARKTYSLVENLLLWARSQTSKIKNEPQEFLLKELLLIVINHVQEEANSKEVEIIDMTNNELKVYADFDMLTIILRNLLSNAVKFNKVRGKIKIKANKKKDMIIISICDTGLGLKPEEISSLFRIDVNKIIIGGSNQEKGSGLGLILCKDFVNKMNGTIEVESEIGKGSCFTISLPTKKLAASVTGRPDNNEQTTKNEKKVNHFDR